MKEPPPLLADPRDPKPDIEALVEGLKEAVEKWRENWRKLN